MRRAPLLVAAVVVVGLAVYSAREVLVIVGGGGEPSDVEPQEPDVPGGGGAAGGAAPEAPVPEPGDSNTTAPPSGGRWTGTVTMEETIDTTSGGQAPFDAGAHTLQESENTRVTIDVTETVSELPSGDGGVVATLKGRITGQHNRLKTYKGWVRQSCGATSNRKMDNTSKDTVTGSGDGEATILLSLAGSGSYFVSTNSDAQVPLTGEFSGEIEVFGSGCAVSLKPSGYAHAPSTMPIGDDIGGSGQAAPRTYVVSGQSVEHRTPDAPQPGVTYAHTRTIRWDLRRQ